MIWPNDTEGALRLIEAGADLDARGEMDEMPLHVAERQGNQVVIAALLAAGARTDIV